MYSTEADAQEDGNTINEDVVLRGVGRTYTIDNLGRAYTRSTSLCIANNGKFKLPPHLAETGLPPIGHVLRPGDKMYYTTTATTTNEPPQKPVAVKYPQNVPAHVIATHYITTASSLRVYIEVFQILDDCLGGKISQANSNKSIHSRAKPGCYMPLTSAPYPVALVMGPTVNLRRVIYSMQHANAVCAALAAKAIGIALPYTRPGVIPIDKESQKKYRCDDHSMFVTFGPTTGARMKFKQFINWHQIRLASKNALRDDYGVSEPALTKDTRTPVSGRELGGSYGIGEMDIHNYMTRGAMPFLKDLGGHRVSLHICAQCQMPMIALTSGHWCPYCLSTHSRKIHTTVASEMLRTWLRATNIITVRHTHNLLDVVFDGLDDKDREALTQV